MIKLNRMIGRKMKATKRSVIMNQEFWTEIDQLVCDSNIVIGRPNGSFIPNMQTLTIKLIMDIGGIDVRVGNDSRQQIDTVALLI